MPDRHAAGVKTHAPQCLPWRALLLSCWAWPLVSCDSPPPTNAAPPAATGTQTAAAPSPAETLAAVKAWLAEPVESRDPAKLPVGFDRETATQVVSLLASAHLGRLAEERRQEMEEKSLTHEGKTMRWLERTFGDEPEDGRSLWISMHGGGGAPSRVNDGQWQNQIRLYQPAEGIYLAPRAPTDTWNLWHEGHIDPMFDRLIENHIALRNVNPDKIYLMGYSAGGDGVWQLAPRMADRFAAAAMMAGHPNEAKLDGLRNLPFALFMGGDDTAYDRHRIAAERATELARLAEQDPGGYIHMSRIYEGVGHWMNLRDAEALPWMAGFRRQPWPKRLVWLQDDVTHTRFYWLELPEGHPAKAGDRIEARIEGQRIELQGDVPAGLVLRLSDALLDLDQEIQVSIAGRELPPQRVRREAAEVLRSLSQRADAATAATARLVVP